MRAERERRTVALLSHNLLENPKLIILADSPHNGDYFYASYHLEFRIQKSIHTRIRAYDWPMETLSFNPVKLIRLAAPFGQTNDEFSLLIMAKR